MPAILAIVVPILVGLVLSVPGVMGLLAGGLTSGFAVAVFMANAGGAWDNAKKCASVSATPSTLPQDSWVDVTQVLREGRHQRLEQGQEC